MKINRDNLIKKVKLKIDDNLVENVLSKFSELVRLVDDNPIDIDIEILFYDKLNIDLDLYNKKESFLQVLKMSDIIRDFYIKNGTYENISKYKDSIIDYEEGWLTFKSSNLTGISDYNIDEISHSFYIAASPNELVKLMKILLDIYTEEELPFYFKINSEASLGMKNSLILYSSTEQLDNTLEVLSKLENEYPQIIKKLSKPHILTGNINNWVGYVSESKKEELFGNYMKIMSSIFVETFQENINETDNICRDLRKKVLSYCINPNNICFNFDALQEIALLPESEKKKIKCKKI